MSEPTLVVSTAFTDILQLAEGLVGRVEPERLMLYGPDAYEPGSVISFTVTLYDGTVAFEGQGRVTHSEDGGEERDAQTRFDIIFDNLEFVGSGSVVFERILLIQQQEPGSETGEVSLEETVELGAEEFDDADRAIEAAPELLEVPEPVEEPEQLVEHQPPEPPAYEAPLDVSQPEELLQVAVEDVDSVEVLEELPDEGLAEAPMDDFQDLAVASGGEASNVQAPIGAPLLRPSLAGTWEPVVQEESGSRPASGYFQFTGGLPTPGLPPRPELDPSMVVQRARRPSDAEAAAAEPANIGPPELPPRVPDVAEFEAGAATAPQTAPEALDVALEVEEPNVVEDVPVEEGPTEAYDLRNLPPGVSPASVGMDPDPGTTESSSDSEAIEVELQDVGDDSSFEDVARELEDGP